MDNFNTDCITLNLLESICNNSNIDKESVKIIKNTLPDNITVIDTVSKKELNN